MRMNMLIFWGPHWGSSFPYFLLRTIKLQGISNLNPKPSICRLLTEMLLRSSGGVGYKV